MKRACMLSAVVAVLCSSAASAQVRGIEITPMGGYRWSTNLSSVPGIREFNIKDGPVYGVAIGSQLGGSGAAAEISWAHWNGSFEGIRETLGGDTDFSADFSRDDIFVNGLWYLSPRPGPTKGYFTAGAGVAIFDSENASATGRFGWQIGLGIRHEVNDRFAIRTDFKWLPVWVTTGSGIWCDPFYCYSVPTGESFDQFEWSGGLVMKMGRHN